MTPEKNLRRLLLALNLLALPIYWVESQMVAQQIQMRPEVQDLSAGALALLIAAAVILGWRRSTRVGGSLQILAFAPFVVTSLIVHAWAYEGSSWYDARDVRLAAAVLATVVIPGLLIGLTLIAIRRRT